MTVTLLDDVELALYDEYGNGPAPKPIAFIWSDNQALNEAVSFKYAGVLSTWALLKDGEILDAGELKRQRHLRPGDRLVFRHGAIKAAAVGDVLGITCVFMPSGFGAGVAPPVTAVPGGYLGGTLGDFAYAGQEERIPRIFWLPKRRWAEMPKALDGWQKRLTRPPVGVQESLVRREQELVALGVI